MVPVAGRPAAPAPEAAAVQERLPLLVVPVAVLGLGLGLGQALGQALAVAGPVQAPGPAVARPERL